MTYSELSSLAVQAGQKSLNNFTSEDMITIMIELITRVRKVFFIVTVLTIAIAFLPTRLFDHQVSRYIPAIYLFLSVVIDHSVANMIFNGDVQIVVSSPLSVISVCVKLAIMISVVINLPIVLYEFYNFIEPGLYDNEKQLLKEAVQLMLVLFTIGSLIAYYIVVPITLRVLTSTTIPLLDFGSTPMVALFTLESIFTMVFWTVLSTGFLYTLPEIMYILVIMGVVDVEVLERKKKSVFLAILILAAIITPDPTFVSMVVLSLPLMAIYQVILQRGYSKLGIRKYKFVKGDFYGQ